MAACGNRWRRRCCRLPAPRLAYARTRPGIGLITAPQLSFFPTAIDSRPTAATVTRVKRPGLPVPQPVREPLIYVTQGSEMPKMPMFAPTARVAVEAARHTGYQVILSIGSADPAAMGDLGGGEVARWVDQTEVLPRARVVISHGGAGITLDALAAATPMITIPFFTDQPYNADSLAVVKVGRTVPPGNDLASRLSEALRRLDRRATRFRADGRCGRLTAGHLRRHLAARTPRPPLAATTGRRRKMVSRRCDRPATERLGHRTQGWSASLLNSRSVGALF